MSASQKKSTACLRRWGAVRLEGMKEPQGEAAKRGTVHHAEMEAWARFGIVPKSKPALAALKYVPPPGIAEVEVPVRFNGPEGAYLGYIDLAYDITPEGKACPVGTTGVTVIHDHKFTGSLRNAKTAEELVDDEAVTIYGWEAYLGGAREVYGRWVYVEMNGSCPTKEVWFPIERARVVENLSTMDHEVGELHELFKKHRRGLLKVVDLPTDTSQCYAFKQQCHVMGTIHCPSQQSSFSLTGATKMSADFKSAIMASFPGGVPAIPGLPPIPGVPAAATALPAIPPALPVIPAVKPIDAAWEQHAKDLRGTVPPAPEAGFVNPPEAPKVAAVSPEHAAQLQGIVAPAGTVEVTDDLTALDRDQLKALAVQMGAVPTNSRAQAAALRAAIRGVRAGTVPAAPAAAPELPAIPQVPVITPEMQRVMNTPSTIAQAIRQSETQAANTITKPIHTLYINCQPRNTDGIPDLQTLVDDANRKMEVADYRMVEFGKGAAGLCHYVKEAIEAETYGPNLKLVIDARTPEGSVLCNVLCSLAQDIVRNF